MGTGRAPRRGIRYVFRIDSDTDGMIIRIVDPTTDRVFREFPVEEFLAFARKNKDVREFFFGNAS